TIKGLFGLGVAVGAGKIVLDLLKDAGVDIPEGTSVIFSSENGQDLTTETTEESLTNPSNDPSETSTEGNAQLHPLLTDLVDNEGAKIVSEPQEGIYLQNGEFPNGIYLYNDGTAYRPDLDESGRWDEE